MLLRQALLVIHITVLQFALWIPFDSNAFVLRSPIVKHRCGGHVIASMSAATVVEKSSLIIPNAKEGYELNGLLTVKHAESKSLWVLCHGLCSSLDGTVPRFVSEKLDANTFRWITDVVLSVTTIIIIVVICNVEPRYFALHNLY